MNFSKFFLSSEEGLVRRLPLVGLTLHSQSTSEIKGWRGSDLTFTTVKERLACGALAGAVAQTSMRLTPSLCLLVLPTSNTAFARDCYALGFNFSSYISSGCYTTQNANSRLLRAPSCLWLHDELPANRLCYRRNFRVLFFIFPICFLSFFFFKKT